MCRTITMATMLPCSLHMVGARDIVEYPDAVSGWLRRMGSWERFLTPVVLQGLNLKWRQRFVVIANGFLYVFKDETSSRPVHASSLAEYYASENFDSGDYTFLEAPLMPGPSERTMRASSRGPAFQSDNSSDYYTDDLDEEYFETDQGKPESGGARSIPLPENNATGGIRIGLLSSDTNEQQLYIISKFWMVVVHYA